MAAEEESNRDCKYHHQEEILKADNKSNLVKHGENKKSQKTEKQPTKLDPLPRVVTMTDSAPPSNNKESTPTPLGLGKSSEIKPLEKPPIPPRQKRQQKQVTLVKHGENQKSHQKEFQVSNPDLLPPEVTMADSAPPPNTKESSPSMQDLVMSSDPKTSNFSHGSVIEEPNVTELGDQEEIPAGSPLNVGNDEIQTDEVMPHKQKTVSSIAFIIKYSLFYT